MALSKLIVASGQCEVRLPLIYSGGAAVQLRRSLRFDCRVAMSRQNLQKANETEADMHSSIHVWELFDFYLFNLFYFEF